MGLFKKILGKVFSFLKSKPILDYLKEEYVELAEEVVSELNLSNLSNSEKRSAALAKIGLALKAKGVEIKENGLRLLIELAVAKLKLQ